MKWGQKPQFSRARLVWGKVLAALTILGGVVLGASNLPPLVVGAYSMARIDTDALEAPVVGMPGVTGAMVNFVDNGSFNSTVQLTVDMPTATAEQITAVVNEIIDMGKSPLQEVALVLDEERATTLSRPVTKLNAEQIGAEVRSLRRFATAVQAAHGVEWTRDQGTDDSTVRVRGLLTPIPETLAAIRTYLGGQVTLAYLNPARENHTPHWTVEFPFTIEQQNRVQHVLSALALPVETIEIGQQGRIDALTVALADPAMAYQQLTEVIAAVGAGPERPLWLTWRPPNFSKLYTGSVDVGRCAYPDYTIETHPQKYLSTTEIDLQQQLRRQFDTCP